MIPPTPNSAKPRTGGRSSSFGLCSISWASGGILDQYLGRAKDVPFADRAFVLVANRLIAPASEHGLAGWLETDFVCDRKGRRFIPHWHQRRRVRVHHRNRRNRHADRNYR